MALTVSWSPRTTNCDTGEIVGVYEGEAGETPEPTVCGAMDASTAIRAMAWMTT
jgi:hypothetical protein